MLFFRVVKPSRYHRLLISIPLTIIGLGPTLLQAFDFEKGGLYGSIDTTLTAGHSNRVSEIDSDLVGIANGGTAFSTNNDNGNLNYSDKGTFSFIGRFTTELELSYENFGFFARGNGFHDLRSDDTDRTPLTNNAQRQVVSNLNLLDFYGVANFDLGKMPLQIRVGEQVISWGESTFIQNSINTINPVDVSQLRTPGSELRNALLPVGIAWASLGVTNNLSLEAYYQYDYEQILIDPEGTYFSTNDIAGPGADRLFLGFGDVSDLGTTVIGPTSAAASADPFVAGVAPLLAAGGTDGLDASFAAGPRSPDDRPGNGGEYGAALRLYAPQLNDTEFGFYFINYHSRLPIISIQAGTQASVGNTVAAAAAANSAGLGAAAATTIGVGAGGLFGANNAAAAAADGFNCAFASAAINPTSLSNFTGFTGAPASYAQQCILNQYIGSANYFIEYPEDIKLLGLSFNTELGTTGIALQGEYSFRRDVPLQIDVQELLLAAGTTLAANPVLAASPTIAGTVNNQVTNGGTLAPGTIIPGFIERNVSQFQVTATKVFGPTFNANTAVLIGEVGITHVHGMPNKSVLRLEAPGTHTTGNPFHSGLAGFHAGKAFESADHYPDATSWGYQVRGQLQYLNAFGAVNVSPRFAWRHDVGGITPGPGGNFLKGRKAITMGLGFSYQNEWTADLAYTNFFGAGRHNLLNDRDFVAFNLGYSF